MKKIMGLIGILVIATILGACSNYKFKADTEYEIADFTVTDHRGETVTLDSLKGKPWLAMFIFTNCTTICQPMTYNMTVIQEELKERGVEDYNIVGFSVDPKRDTPEVLSEYLSRYTVPDESKWHLVTNYDQAWIEQFGLNSFKTIVKMPENGDQVLHASTFYLVDENGVAVKNYTGYSESEEGVPFDTIAIDMETLIEERLK
ncbi:SCO family protein [Lysinibacillus endophyticus]|uniref:SCO family protein n=1 Tax=Ureibacillus endophyticus TaxID=1978490 RepID=A0A494YW57_9BACL|nr:SCO family protein [Lysinibacillus endophyticus]MCP1144950.1 SCO family protein [Lysinibacillus endophyticus]RKQ14455.1 SCO family protein [Lysinibacillus endophyticus]